MTRSSLARVAYTVVVVLLTLAAAHAYERAWPWLFPDPLERPPSCAASPWQRVTITQNGWSQTLYLSCTAKHDEILAWPSPADGGEP